MSYTRTTWQNGETALSAANMNNIEDGIEEALAGVGDAMEGVTEALAVTRDILNIIYPVGSIYMSVNTTNPGTLFPGTTWTKIQNRFLLAAGSSYTSGDTGGSATVKLTAAQSGVASHNHPFTKPTIGGHNHKITDDTYNLTTSATSPLARTTAGSGSAVASVVTSPGGTVNRGGQYTASTTLSLTGGSVGNATATSASEAHNNMPPYLVVNIWKRTA